MIYSNLIFQIYENLKLRTYFIKNGESDKNTSLSIQFVQIKNCNHWGFLIASSKYGSTYLLIYTWLAILILVGLT